MIARRFVVGLLVFALGAGLPTPPLAGRPSVADVSRSGDLDTAGSVRARRGSPDPAAARKPNVIVIITDDQGHGDLGIHGNPKIRTPNLDRLARDSVQLKAFCVSPVCSPTRASLLTGRYNYRTGVVDTFLGRSMMHGEETTLAEMLAAAGYRTGIFGKWHLGDNYPMRPMDQGFQESLVHRGGGIGQPADPPGNRYSDPVLQKNGKPTPTKGYCSDVFTGAAIDFVSRPRLQPFFVYLAFNCPHDPLQVPDEYAKPYREMNLAHGEFPKIGHPLPGKANEEVIAKVYAMVTNIDDNVGRLLTKLDELKLANDTIVIFLTDNGPQQPRYNSGMLERKGSVHDGGIHVPCFIRWPAQLKARSVETIAAHIDLTPTLLAACGLAPPDKVAFDGVNLLPLLKSEKVDWPDRTLYFQWHRGDTPELNRAFAARSQRYKLVQPLGVQGQKLPEPLRFKLYDMQVDPLEQKDIAEQHPEIVARMRKGYEEWFKDVSGARGFAPPRMHLGTAHEDPVVLTRQDWRGPKASWAADGVGHWEVEVARGGDYSITLRFAATRAAGQAHLKLGSVTHRLPLDAGATECTFDRVKLSAGPARLEAEIHQGEQITGVNYVEVKRVE